VAPAAYVVLLPSYGCFQLIIPGRDALGALAGVGPVVDFSRRQSNHVFLILDRDHSMATSHFTSLIFLLKRAREVKRERLRCPYWLRCQSYSTLCFASHLLRAWLICRLLRSPRPRSVPDTTESLLDSESPQAPRVSVGRAVNLVRTHSSPFGVQQPRHS
jgi:hypothetical protein